MKSTRTVGLSERTRRSRRWPLHPRTLWRSPSSSMLLITRCRKNRDERRITYWSTRWRKSGYAAPGEGGHASARIHSSYPAESERPDAAYLFHPNEVRAVPEYGKQKD